MGKILVIGCVSFDTIHMEQGDGRTTHNTIGGAGLFTALAAAHAGAEVTLYAPKPEPLPRAFIAVNNAVNWIGPRVAPDEMPRLEIVHHGHGRATLIGAGWGPEKLLVPEDLSKNWSENLSKDGAVIFDMIHIAALSTAGRQLEFLRFLRNQSSSNRISAGTYARAIGADGDAVRQLLTECDVFFMNSNEATLLFKTAAIVPQSGQLIFVTDGKNGAIAYTDQSTIHLDASPADELDPTGAGDTFCGATLAALSRQEDVPKAGRLGAALAARVIEHPGSSFYFQDTTNHLE